MVRGESAHPEFRRGFLDKNNEEVSYLVFEID